MKHYQDAKIGLRYTQPNQVLGYDLPHGWIIYDATRGAPSANVRPEIMRLANGLPIALCEEGQMVLDSIVRTT